jgi:hypothetical protein
MIEGGWTASGLSRLRVRGNPALVLFLLAPAVGELLSGSAPPSEFFTPFGFTILLGLYGCGAVLTRELKVLWGKGIGSLLLLGAAYGALEEGVMVASWFSPVWPDLGVLGVFGRWLGVNWVWAAELTMYHAIISITVPVILVELAYPKRKCERWLTDGWLKVIASILMVDVAVGFILFSLMLDYFPPLPQYFLAFIVVVVFTYIAYRLPADWARHGIKPMKTPLFYAVFTAFGALASGIIFWILPNLSFFPLFPVVVILIGFSVIFGSIKLLAGYDWKKATSLHWFALTFGSLFLFIISAFFQELDKSRTDNTAGMGLVGGVTIFIMVLLWLKLKRRYKSTTVNLEQRGRQSNYLSDNQ